MADENKNEFPQTRPDKDQPNNEFVWIVLIALFIGLLLFSGYGLMVIYQVFVDLLTGATGSLQPPNPLF